MKYGLAKRKKKSVKRRSLRRDRFGRFIKRAKATIKRRKRHGKRKSR